MCLEYRRTFFLKFHLLNASKYLLNTHTSPVKKKNGVFFQLVQMPTLDPYKYFTYFIFRGRFTFKGKRSKLKKKCKLIYFCAE